MKKQASLALALCLTAVVGFVVVAYGSRVGFFGGSRAASGQDDTGAALVAIATYAAGFATTPTPAPAPEPVFVDEYVYEDVVVQPPAAVPGSSAARPAEAAPRPAEAPSVDDASDPAPPDELPTVADIPPTETPFVNDVGHAETPYDDDEEDEHESEPGHEGGLLETEDLKGTVVAVSGGMITITGSRLGEAVISATEQTQYAVDGGGFLSLAQIGVGMYLEAKVLEGEGDSPTGPGGTWVATAVTWKPRGP